MAFQEGFNPFGGIVKSKGEDGGGDSGGGVKLGNLAAIEVSSEIPADFDDYKNNYTYNNANKQKFGYTEIFLGNTMVSTAGWGDYHKAADGTVCKLHANYLTPTVDGPVEACIVMLDDISIDPDSGMPSPSGTLKSYPNVIYSSADNAIILPISDIPEPYIGDNGYETGALIFVRANAKGLV